MSLARGIKIIPLNLVTMPVLSVYYNVYMTSRSRPQHHIVYIPGLGDDKNVRGQRFAMQLWRSYGVYGHSHPVFWAKDEPLKEKLQGVQKEIDDLLARGRLVTLIAA